MPSFVGVDTASSASASKEKGAASKGDPAVFRKPDRAHGHLSGDHNQYGRSVAILAQGQPRPPTHCTSNGDGSSIDQDHGFPTAGLVRERCRQFGHHSKVAKDLLQASNFIARRVNTDYLGYQTRPTDNARSALYAR